jgi:peptidoglycan/xylan/chitin deacetylase (PgdA/CDA1 family)
MKATFFVLSQHLERTDCPGVGPRMIKVLNKKRQVVSTSTYNILKNRPSTVFPELALAERDAGHAVASHSYYHSVVPKDNDVEQNCEINLAMDVFTDKLGVRPTFFRLPYGAGVSISKVRAKIAAANAIHVYWSVDTLDWQDHDPASIVNRTLKAIQTGGRGVILFHDIHPQSVIASEQIMAYLKDPKNKLETVTLPEIVDRLNGAGPH